jgi:hypothetical protein
MENIFVYGLLFSVSFITAWFVLIPLEVFYMASAYGELGFYPGFKELRRHIVCSILKLKYREKFHEIIYICWGFTVGLIVIYSSLQSEVGLGTVETLIMYNIILCAVGSILQNKKEVIGTKVRRIKVSL